jgi:hypothetical protein
MPRVGTCPCGAKLEIPDPPPAEGVRCVQCGRLLKVRVKKPAAPPVEGLPAVSVAGMRCPSCKEPVEPGVVFCVRCGTNLGDGSRMSTKVEKPVRTSAFVRDFKVLFLYQLKRFWWLFIVLGLLAILAWII